MESEDLRYRDIVAQLALFNMLKVNLSCCPDLYRTLLAVLCDFDPNQPNSKHKTSQYIRLLISDKLLADCIIVSLPQGDQERLELEAKTNILPLKQRVLANQECSNIERRTKLWLSQQAQTMKDVEVSEDSKTCKSITIIVSGRRDSTDCKDVCEDRTVTIPGIPAQPLEVSANHSRKQQNNNIRDSQQYNDKTSLKICTDIDRNPSPKNKECSVSWSNSIKQMVTTMPMKQDSKQTDSLKATRPKLVLPVHIQQAVSHGLVTTPIVTTTSQVKYVRLGNGDTLEPDYQVAPGYKPTSSVTTVYQPERSHCFNPQIQVWRKSSNTENTASTSISTARNDVQVSSDVKRYASTSVDEEPALKVRKLSQSANQCGGSAASHSERIQCFEDMLVHSDLVTLSKSQDNASNSRQKLALNDLLSKLPIQSNKVSDSGLENSVKNKNSESRGSIGSSWQEGGVRTPSLSKTETRMTKSTSQDSFMLPVSKVPSTTGTMTKQYHLSYPIKMSVNPETTKNASYTYEASSQPGSVASLSNNNSCSSGICPESAKYSTSLRHTDTYCYGLTDATKSFPYRQQIHLSNVLDFSTDCVVNNPPVSCKTETMQVETEHRMMRDGLKVKIPSLDLLRPDAETQVSERTIIDNTDSLLNNPSISNPQKMEPRTENWKESVESRLRTDSLGKMEESKDSNSGKQTFLIIETKTSNGSDQVQIKLNPQNSGNLLGELLKLKPGLVLKQGCVEANNSDNAAKEIVPTTGETSDRQVENDQHTTTNDSYVRVDDKSSLSDISGDCTDSEEFQCSDDQYDFSDQSDIVPIHIDNHPGEPKLVAFPLLHTNAFQQNFQQRRNDDGGNVRPMTTPKPFCEPYSNINTPILTLPGSMTATLTDNVQLDALSSVPTGGSDNGNQFRFSSCGMSPYLLGLIPDMTSSTYDDNLSLEGSDDVFVLNEYITPNMVKSRSTNLESESTEDDHDDK